MAIQCPDCGVQYKVGRRADDAMTNDDKALPVAAFLEREETDIRRMCSAGDSGRASSD